MIICDTVIVYIMFLIGYIYFYILLCIFCLLCFYVPSCIFCLPIKNPPFLSGGYTLYAVFCLIVLLIVRLVWERFEVFLSGFVCITGGKRIVRRDDHLLFVPHPEGVLADEYP